MTIALLVPVLLGIVGILQGGMNKQMSMEMGLAQVPLTTNIVTTLVCLIFYLTVKYFPQYFPDFFHTKVSILSFKAWYIIPAVFGFLIVAGLPFAIAKLGAVKVTVALIAAQMLTSVIWDRFIEKLPLSGIKIVGMIFALFSVILISSETIKK